MPWFVPVDLKQDRAKQFFFFCIWLPPSGILCYWIFTNSSVFCTQENKETGMERVIDSVALFKWVPWIKECCPKELNWSVCNSVWIVLYRKPGVTGRGLYKLRPECAKMFNLYFHHYSRADQSKVKLHYWKCNSQGTIVKNTCLFLFFSVILQAEEAQRKIKRQNGEDSGTNIHALGIGKQFKHFTQSTQHH